MGSAAHQSKHIFHISVLFSNFSCSWVDIDNLLKIFHPFIGSISVFINLAEIRGISWKCNWFALARLLHLFLDQTGPRTDPESTLINKVPRFPDEQIDIFRFLRPISRPQLPMTGLSVNWFWCLPSKNISISTPTLLVVFLR